MTDNSKLGGHLFQQQQMFSLLAQNPATAKYLGQADVCRIITELRKNPSAYAKYRTDSRIVEIAAQLASTQTVSPAWPPSWSSYSRSNTGQDGTPTTTTNDTSSWRSARRTRFRDDTASTSPTAPAPVRPSLSTFDATGFFAAVRSGSLGSVSAVVDRNETAMFQEDDFGYTPLHLAAQNGHTHIVTYLLGKGADVDQKQAAGYSPLHIAVLSDKTSVALTLIENGANVHHKDNEGNTALEYALRNDNPELIAVLIEAATSDDGQRVQRERRKQENERKRQTAALALPAQVERKIEHGGRRVVPAPVPVRSLFGDSEDEGLSMFNEDDDYEYDNNKEESDSHLNEKNTSTRASRETQTEEKAKETKGERYYGNIDDLFGWGESDFEPGEDPAPPKGKEAKPTTSTASQVASARASKPTWSDMADEEEEEKNEDEANDQNPWGMISALFTDTNGEEDDESILFAAAPVAKPDVKSAVATTTPTVSHPLAAASSVSTSTSITVAAGAQTVVIKASASATTSSSDEVSSLLEQIQRLEAKIAEKDRELLAKDDKISVLEEDTWCRICMDRKIETVLLWCGHNILCLPCSQKVQKAKKECPVCSKTVTRVVRTYRA